MPSLSKKDKIVGCIIGIGMLLTTDPHLALGIIVFGVIAYFAIKI